jgi:hypothetical protein
MMNIVWIESENCWGEVLERHLSHSKIIFIKDGHSHEEYIENEDLINLQQLGIEYESDF